MLLGKWNDDFDSLGDVEVEKMRLVSRTELAAQKASTTTRAYNARAAVGCAVLCHTAYF